MIPVTIDQHVTLYHSRCTLLPNRLYTSLAWMVALGFICGHCGETLCRR